jgi:hypothetical protein
VNPQIDEVEIVLIDKELNTDPGGDDELLERETPVLLGRVLLCRVLEFDIRGVR